MMMDAQRELVFPPLPYGLALQRLDTDYLIVAQRLAGIKPLEHGLDRRSMDIEHLRRSYDAAVRLNLDGWTEPIEFAGRTFEDPSALVAEVGSRLEVFEREGRWA